MALENIQPCSNLASCKQMVVFLEQTFDTINLRHVTVDDLYNYEGQLRSVILGVRNVPVDQGVKTSEGILQNLRPARDLLSLAILLLEEEKRNKQFFEHLRSCQVYLKQALTYWK